MSMLFGIVFLSHQIGAFIGEAQAVGTVSLNKKWYETDSYKDVREIDRSRRPPETKLTTSLRRTSGAMKSGFAA